MKKIYSALASIALLFSLRAIAAPLAEKTANDKAKGKEATEKVIKDIVRTVNPQGHEIMCPPCKGMGGC